MQWTVIRLPILSAAQLTPLYSEAADIAMLIQKGKIRFVDAVNKFKAVSSGPQTLNIIEYKFVMFANLFNIPLL
jgi:hypothetical protein